MAPTLYFDHRMTNCIKGIAIIMMMILLFPLEELGIVSMEIWFIHCIFFAEATKKVFMPILYWPGHPVLVTLWGLALCFAVAWILDWPIRFLIRQKNKLFLDTTVKSV